MIVIDYDAGNTANVLRALGKIGVNAKLSRDPKEILQADGLVLPGVGAFPTAMAKLVDWGLVEVIKQAVAQGIPLLGICLGMQLLLDKGLEHTPTKGLGLIAGTCRPIPRQDGYPVPHMGWNKLTIRQDNALTKDVEAQSVYFVHSYYADVADVFLNATSSYSIEVPAMISHGKVYGVQFHPEKSGECGLMILRRFKEVVDASFTSD
ncbi:imidazole glycerol phosphate synthase subunit HisH [Streptococcus sp. SQ9-PEA]|uniref:Imidazole glycerol phosphate synthase subunit HisH n=2 Tax=Streptococcus sciuri TaxID=2973939 RepID=A0ABT2F7X8_9STRE|nr:imidazole glycerol phosphate synthase subunit HisH [Streptococcus sciuri]MCS4488126.1 imidazole glycerol phosphate synthase subunit HisH [Streptococcus sciuri]